MTSHGALASATPAGLRARPWWPWAKRIATWTFLALVGWLIVDRAQTIAWGEVGRAIADMPRWSLVVAVLLTIASHATYSTFDLLGRRMTGHRLGTGTVMGVTFVAYAFNLNLGSLVGSVAMRFRLYSRLGLDNDTITRVVGFSMLTNWFGYLAIAGAAFAFGSVHLPTTWKIDDGGLRLVGALLMLAALAYLVLCATAGRHVWTVRGHDIETPSLRMGLVQLVLAAGNWALMGAVLYVLLQQRVPYGPVLAVLLVASVAGLISHVPAGLGVLEAVFVALLGDAVGQGRLLAAVIAYRAIYTSRRLRSLHCSTW